MKKREGGEPSCRSFNEDERAANKRLERTRHERASLLSNFGEPLKRNVGFAKFQSTLQLTNKTTPIYIRRHEHWKY